MSPLSKVVIAGKSWDSSLYVPPEVGNAVLEIVLRLKLTAHQEQSIELRPRDPDGRIIEDAKVTLATEPWEQKDWMSFCANVKTLSQRYWNNEFWLRGPSNYDGIDVPRSPLGRTGVFGSKPTHRPVVKCQLTLELVEGANSHRTVNVLRLAKGEQPIRHSARLWDQSVVDARSLRKLDGRHEQYPVVHEVGHLLGQLHPGVGTVPGCTPKDNSQGKCYCTDGWCGELMGVGMVITNRLAAPWQSAMENHTGVKASEWRVLRRPQNPLLIPAIHAMCNGSFSFGAAGAMIGR